MATKVKTTQKKRPELLSKSTSGRKIRGVRGETAPKRQLHYPYSEKSGGGGYGYVHHDYSNGHVLEYKRSGPLGKSKAYSAFTIDGKEKKHGFGSLLEARGWLDLKSKPAATSNKVAKRKRRSR